MSYAHRKLWGYVNDLMYHKIFDPRSEPIIKVGSGDRKIIFFHGNNCTSFDCITDCENLAGKLNASIYLIEYPGYGVVRNLTCQPHECFGKTVDYLVSMARKIDVKVSFYGFSLGGAYAAAVAKKWVELGNECQEVIIHNSFATFSLMTGGYLMSMLGVNISTVDTLYSIKDHTNLRWIHSDNDTMFTQCHSDLIKERIPNIIIEKRKGEHHTFN